MGSEVLCETVQRGEFAGIPRAKDGSFLAIRLYRCRDKRLHIASLES